MRPLFGEASFGQLVLRSNLRLIVDTDDDASSTAAPGSRAPNDVAIYICLRVARDHVGKREAPLHVAR